MAMQDVIAQIDAEISKLEQAKALLSGTDGKDGPFPVTKVKGKRGRPKGSVNAKKAVAAPATAPAKKRTLSAAGRKAIADAMRKRWAAKKAAK